MKTRTLLAALLVTLTALAGCLGAGNAGLPVNDAPDVGEGPGGPGQGVEGGATQAVAPAFRAPVKVAHDAGAEPMLDVAPDGTLFVTGTGIADTGTPSQGVWRSTDGGATWQEVTPVFPTANHTGMDNALAVGGDGTVYYANAAGLTLHAFRSTDAGETWLPMPVPPVPVPMHRTWFATEGESGVHLVVEGLPLYTTDATGFANAVLYHTRSQDSGASWSAPAVVDDGTFFGTNLAVGPGGELYAVRIMGEDGGGAEDEGRFYLRVSTDGGETWARRDMFPIRTRLVQSWVSLAADPAGTLYMAWAEARNGTGIVLLSHSADGGATWTAPAPVAPVNGSQTFPWIAARAPGEVGVAWYAADTPGLPDDVDAPWFVDYALVTGADTARPVAHRVRVTPEPVHESHICTRGPGCIGDGDRSLLDFLWVDFGPDGRAHLAFASSQWDRPTAFPVYAGEAEAFQPSAP